MEKMIMQKSNIKSNLYLEVRNIFREERKKHNERDYYEMFDFEKITEERLKAFCDNMKLLFPNTEITPRLVFLTMFCNNRLTNNLIDSETKGFVKDVPLETKSLEKYNKQRELYLKYSEELKNYSLQNIYYRI